MKHMKKIIYVLILALAVLSGLVFGNREIKNEIQPSPKPLSIADQKADQDVRKKWEASPDGIMYKEWELSPEGKKVQASHDKIRKYLEAFTDMEAVVALLLFSAQTRNHPDPNGLLSGLKAKNTCNNLFLRILSS